MAGVALDPNALGETFHEDALGRPTASERSADQPPANARPTNCRGGMKGPPARVHLGRLSDPYLRRTEGESKICR
ncbi:hypothetical protein [Halorussus caseinilyticus]|uniref:Uncharacterized protein n=1 Tax=Halorussus caseinilyticus TaxID=3034025 RepID=A0ABD5WLA2_9EURY|nr:hypothetical protein [Halorussus sp. DT72]